MLVCTYRSYLPNILITIIIHTIQSIYVHTYILYICLYRYGAERRAEPEALSAEAANSNSVEGTAIPGTNMSHMIHVHD